MSLSKTQIDRLGERLKLGSHTESDLRMLDEYRRSFGEAYEAVIQTIRQHGAFPTGRSAKSTLSIVEKLRRESIRLSQMQDIAGCRIVVKKCCGTGSIRSVVKNRLPRGLRNGSPRESQPRLSSGPHHRRNIREADRNPGPEFPNAAKPQPKSVRQATDWKSVVQRCAHGAQKRRRKTLQHLSEVSEKFSDVLDPAIKYGGGSDASRAFLTLTSKLVADIDTSEKREREGFALIQKLNLEIEKIDKPGSGVSEQRELGEALTKIRRALEVCESVLQKNTNTMVQLRELFAEKLTNEISRLDELKRHKQ
jgi:hypothetical protein